MPITYTIRYYTDGNFTAGAFTTTAPTFVTGPLYIEVVATSGATGFRTNGQGQSTSIETGEVTVTGDFGTIAPIVSVVQAGTATANSIAISRFTLTPTTNVDYSGTSNASFSVATTAL